MKNNSKKCLKTPLPHISTLTPIQVYQSRQTLHKAQQKKLEARDSHLATARGLIFLLAAVLAWQVLINKSPAPAWLLAPATVFLFLVIAHSRIVKLLDRSRRAVDYYTRRLNQLAGQWAGQGNAGTRYYDLDHSYSADLDIFGEGSLFELICEARTRLGEDMLAAWLSAGADLLTITQRQQAIEELRNHIEFREQLALLDAQANDDLDQKQLQLWARMQARQVSRWQRSIAAVLGILAFFSVAAWITGYGLVPLLVVVVIELLFYATHFREIRRVAAEADAASAGLSILSQVLDLIEQQEFNAPLLQTLRENLQTQGHPPSWQVRRLRNLIQALNNCLRNQFIAPVAFLLGVPIYVMYRIQCWHQRVGPHIPKWFDTVAQVEALNSLSRYTFDNPADPFPELVEASDGPRFDAIELGHPLIDAANCVRNDMRLDTERRLVMVSGSNMSGKSTLLRTVGINVVLALSGAPVRAKKLLTSRFVIGCVMRTNDSLQQGTSLFYAVISRVKHVVAMAGQSSPLLFLLDEILQGTNSHDRRVGAEGIIAQLIDQSAVGLVTTHDLALTEIADSQGERAINIHFEDRLLNGKMHFDYQIRAGVVKKSNALELMRMIGLNVPLNSK